MEESIIFRKREIKHEIEEMKEKIKKWVNDPDSKNHEIPKIAKWNRISRDGFDKVASKLVKSQIAKWGGFEGGLGKVDDSLSYGLVKFKEPYLLRAWEEGIMVIYEAGLGMIKGLRRSIIGGNVLVLGFGINPLTKEIVGISFYDDSPSFVEHQLINGNGGFYFGSTEYTLPNDMAGGFNHFCIPTGKEYQKYFGIAQEVWEHYLANK